MSNKLQGPELLNMLGKEVNFTFLDNTSLTGRVYTVDPETHNFIVMNSMTTTLLPFSNITNFTIISGIKQPQEVLLSDLQGIDEEHFPQTVHHVTSTNCELLRKRLIHHLDQHRVPCEVKGDEVVIAGVVVCKPPYNADSCASTNDIILGRIQSILKKLDSLWSVFEVLRVLWIFRSIVSFVARCLVNNNHFINAVKLQFTRTLSTVTRRNPILRARITNIILKYSPHNF